MGWSGHARGTVSYPQTRHLSRRGPAGHRRRPAARAAHAAVLAGVRATCRSGGGPEGARSNGARHWRHRTHGVGRRVRWPAAPPADTRARVAARAAAARSARDRDRRTTVALVCRRPGVAAYRLAAEVAVAVAARAGASDGARPSTAPTVAEPAGTVAEPTRPATPKPATSALTRAKGKARDRMGG